MNNSELINLIKNEIAENIPKNFKKVRRQKLEDFLEESLTIAANTIDKREYNNSYEIKEFVLRRLAEWIFNISLSVFESDMDESYDEILKKVAFLVYEVTFKLLEDGIQDDKFYELLEYEVKRHYPKILREVGSKYRKEIKDSEIERDSAFFWQLIFIKYTTNGNRIFYPGFFSDGYVITSEEQFKNYQKFGNKFLIILLCILIFLAKFKLLKAIFYFKLMSIQTFGTVIGLLLLTGIVYNLIVSKLIFKNAIKTHEKFWENNRETIQFLTSFIIRNILVFVTAVALIGLAGTYCKEAYVGVPVIFMILVIFVIYMKKQYKKIDLFTINQEKNAIRSFIIAEISKYENIPHINMIRENLHLYLYDYVDYVYKITKLDYIAITQNIHKFIRSFIRFNKTLYSLGIDEKFHKQLIEDRCLTHFEYA